MSRKQSVSLIVMLINSFVLHYLVVGRKMFQMLIYFHHFSPKITNHIASGVLQSVQGQLLAQAMRRKTPSDLSKSSQCLLSLCKDIYIIHNLNLWPSEKPFCCNFLFQFNQKQRVIISFITVYHSSYRLHVLRAMWSDEQLCGFQDTQHQYSPQPCFLCLSVYILVYFNVVVFFVLFFK